MVSGEQALSLSRRMIKLSAENTVLQEPDTLKYATDFRGHILGILFSKHHYHKQAEERLSHVSR